MGAQCWGGVCVSLLQDGTVHLVYGVLEEPFGSLEAINTSGLQIGLQRVQLLKPNISVPALPSDLHTMEIRAPDVLIPGRKTTYWCHITELPDGFSRHHIVMVPGGRWTPEPRLVSASRGRLRGCWRDIPAFRGSAGPRGPLAA